MKSPKNWNLWVTGLRADSLRRQKLGRLIAGGGSSHLQSWPTPVANDDNKSVEAHLAMKARLPGGARKTITSLNVLVKAWQTPATDSFRSRGGDRKDEPGLDQQARQWRTPDAPTTGGIRTRAKSRGNGHQVVLSEQAMEWPTPTAHFQPRGKNFTKSDGHTKPHDISTAASSFHLALTSSLGGRSYFGQTRILNPLFVEHLMGVPLGWTDFEHLETESFRLWQLMHTERLTRIWQLQHEIEMYEGKRAA